MPDEGNTLVGRRNPLAAVFQCGGVRLSQSQHRDCLKTIGQHRGVEMDDEFVERGGDRSNVSCIERKDLSNLY